MKLIFSAILVFTLIGSGQSFAQNAAKTATINKWEKAVVKLESIQQRYTFAQVDVLLHQQIDTVKTLSQHDQYNRQGELLTIRDTIKGTGLLIADGKKIYLVTAKHLIKATENEGNNLESINELISIKTNINNKLSNDISLMNLSSNVIKNRPFVFSDDKTDLGIISFQKKGSYKTILAYLKKMGCEPIRVKDISAVLPKQDDEIEAIGFPALPGQQTYNSVIKKGKVTAADKSSFEVNLQVYPGDSGSPIFKNDKLIGILSYQAGIKNNIDAAMHPYEKTDSASTIKASKIFLLLRKLQLNENNASFGK